MDEINAVLQNHSSMVYRLAYARMGNRMDADDVFQEVFLKLVTYRTQFQSDEHLKAWLIRITLNQCNSLWRSAWRRMTAPLRDDMASLPREDSWLMDAVTNLPPKYRAVIHLFYYEGLPVEEIGKATGQKPSTIRTQLTRARRILGEQLKEEEGQRYAHRGI